MKMNIVLILVGTRSQSAVQVQSILTRFSGIIRTRLGINRQMSLGEDGSGFIFLELCAGEEQAQELVKELNTVPEVRAQYLKMDLSGCSCPSCSK